MRIVFYIALFILFATTIFLGGCIFSAPRYSGPPVKNFDGREFSNPGNVETRGFQGLLKWLLNREKGEWVSYLDLPYGEKPLIQMDSGIRITFINHSTFLIQVDGINILTDPVWSNRVGPTSWLGPKRFRPPGIRFGTFAQADDGQLEPIQDLKTAMKKYKLNENDFLILEEGVAKNF